jgi:hypothetical protein
MGFAGQPHAAHINCERDDVATGALLGRLLGPSPCCPCSSISRRGPLRCGARYRPRYLRTSLRQDRKERLTGSSTSLFSRAAISRNRGGASSGKNRPGVGDGARATSRLRQMIQLSTDIDLQTVDCSCRPGTENTARTQLRTRLRLSHGRRAGVGHVLIAENLAHPYACGRYSCPRCMLWCLFEEPQ